MAICGIMADPLHHLMKESTQDLMLSLNDGLNIRFYDSFDEGKYTRLNVKFK